MSALVGVLAVLALLIAAAPAEASGLKARAASVLDTAHRGLVGPMKRKGQNYADPNTIASCVNAVRHHVDACEFDLRFTSDDYPVVSHSHSLDGWTNCTGAIAAKPLATVTRCRTAHGERVPALTDFVAQVAAKSRSIKFLEDIKPVEITPQQLSRLVQIDVRHGIVGRRLRFSNPRVEILRRLGRLAPGANKALLVRRGTRLPRAGDLPSDVVDTVLVHVKSLDERLATEPRYFSTLRSHGFGVSVWGAKSLSRMKHLVRLGVEEIVTKRADAFERWRTS
jgi:glycerophosphoryl diester phosphodiesterase